MTGENAQNFIQIIQSANQHPHHPQKKSGIVMFVTCKYCKYCKYYCKKTPVAPSLNTFISVSHSTGPAGCKHRPLRDGSSCHHGHHVHSKLNKKCWQVSHLDGAIGASGLPVAMAAGLARPKPYHDFHHVHFHHFHHFHHYHLSIIYIIYIIFYIFQWISDTFSFHDV